MRDLLLIALLALLGATAAGVLGALALRLLRARSLLVTISVVAATAILAMLFGTLVVAYEMFLSTHDRNVVIIVCLMAAVVAMAVAAALGRWVAARSEALAHAARTFGDDGGFVPPKNGGVAAELAAVTRELEATSARLATSRERERALESSRRELVAWISHDLRTPLAGLRAMAEALEDGVAADPARYHRRIHTEVERLNAMVGDLFELSRIHAGALSLTRSRLSLHELVGDALAGAEPLARERGVRLAADAPTARPGEVPAGLSVELLVEVDAREITRVLGNLLVNAIRRTPEDGTVAVAARPGEDGTVVVSVTDECGGIPEEDLPRVFDTGWRGTHARTPPAGAGLGLAIVRGIVEAHEGRASVRNVEKGCRFEVVLPTRGISRSEARPTPASPRQRTPRPPTPTPPATAANQR
ncbi:sensor histidine kinase [Streptomyces polyrhachis]|uniref:histidine kinase n=1 Tax=Streptomyces polyrhachis TaxID=1282885 RepID=A0ABW2GKY4_9ACTN